MPLFDVIHPDGRTEEVFVHRREELEAMNVKLAPSRIGLLSVSGSKPSPFARQVLDGFKRQEAKGTLKTAWRPDRVKEIWGNT